jgi:hypothetical protein
MSLLSAGDTAGDDVRGILHLPNGDLPFEASVRRRFSDGRIGVQFRWRHPADADALNACLYGNTLQWDINSWTEIRRRGVRFPGLRSGRGSDTGSGPWQIATIGSPGSRRIPCVARCEKASGAVWRVVSYRRPQAADGLELILDGTAVSGLKLASCESLQTGGGTLHVAIIAADSATARCSSHRQPQWSSRTFDALPGLASPAEVSNAR